MDCKKWGWRLGFYSIEKAGSDLTHPCGIVEAPSTFSPCKSQLPIPPPLLERFFRQRFMAGATVHPRASKERLRAHHLVALRARRCTKVDRTVVIWMPYCRIAANMFFIFLARGSLFYSQLLILRTVCGQAPRRSPSSSP